MKYTIQSSKYVVKNFLYLFPFALIPALFLALSMDGEAIVCVLKTLSEKNTRELHFEHIFRAISIFNFASWDAVLCGILGILSMLFCGALMMALMEKHMRIGKRTFNGVFAKLNDNLIPTGGYLLLLLAIYEIWTLVLSALLFFISRFGTFYVAFPIMAIVYLAMHGVLLYGISIIYLWLPCMQITGFKAGEALYYSNQLASPAKNKIFFGQIFFILFAEAAICLCTAFASSALGLAVLSTVLYSFMIMIYCVRMEIAYFDLDNIERADLVKYYQR